MHTDRNDSEVEIFSFFNQLVMVLLKYTQETTTHLFGLAHKV